jgi:hypothetical protein
MSSPSVDLETAPRVAKRQGVRALLDATFGFFVWAAHLLVIYVATALACNFGLGSESGRARTGFATVLVVVTVAAVAITMLHALRRYRQQRNVPELGFRMVITAGCDAVATVAIAWQLLSILLVPMCA